MKYKVVLPSGVSQFVNADGFEVHEGGVLVFYRTSSNLEELRDETEHIQAFRDWVTVNEEYDA